MISHASQKSFNNQHSDPFGMLLVGRNSEGGSEYRFGFQNQEVDNEYFESSINYTYRILNPNIGRFLSVDPLSKNFPSNSTYAFSSNRPIDKNELEGLETGNTRKPGENQNGIYIPAIDNSAIATYPSFNNFIDLSILPNKAYYGTYLNADNRSSTQIQFQDKIQQQKEFQQNRLETIYKNPQNFGNPGTSALIGQGVVDAVAGEYIGYKTFQFFDDSYRAFRELSAIKTPYGNAKQSFSDAALAAKYSINSETPLYRVGAIGENAASEAQFWSLQNPGKLTINDFARNYGVPEKNIRGTRMFIEVGKLKPNASFITREAPGYGLNQGGAIEVVTNPNSVKLESYSTYKTSCYTD